MLNILFGCHNSFSKSPKSAHKFNGCIKQTRSYNTIFEKTFLETVIIHLIRIYHRPSLENLLSQLKTEVSPKSTPSTSFQPYPPEDLTQPKAHYKNQSFLSPPAPTKEPLSSPAGGAAIDTLLQFAVVEFSGILTKE